VSELITATEVGKMLKLHPAHVRDRLSKQSGFPKAMRVGAALRWYREDISDWLVKQSVSPAARRSKRRTACST